MKDIVSSGFRVACEIGEEFASVLRGDVECCAERARRAEGLDPAWSVTEAMDLGNHVVIHFEQPREAQDWDGYIVRVSKATGRVVAEAA